jgi:hypothetical protein
VVNSVKHLAIENLKRPDHNLNEWKTFTLNINFEPNGVRYYFFRNAKDDHKLDEPLSIKIDDCSTILEVDQPSTSSGVGPSPVEDCCSPKQVTI